MNPLEAAELDRLRWVEARVAEVISDCRADADRAVIEGYPAGSAAYRSVARDLENILKASRDPERQPDPLELAQLQADALGRSLQAAREAWARPAH